MKQNRISVSIMQWVACSFVFAALVLLAAQVTARSGQSPKKKIAIEPTVAAGSDPEEAEAKTRARQQPSATVQISKGKRVVPSEFRGDVRKLRQRITQAERKLFHRPLELEFNLRRVKKPLP